MINNSPGVFISFEGGEGAGKSVQIVRLREKLEELGKKIVLIREPGGTAISEQIREVVLSIKNMGMAYTTEVLLFQAARAQVYRELILPSLETGKWVLADRTSDSSIVYQGIVRDFGVEIIKELNGLSTKDTYPDITFLLDVSVEVGLARRAASDKNDRLDLKSKDFHTKVREAYLSLAESEPKRFVVIDANQSIEKVSEEIWRVVAERFELQ
ncbi:MAG: dTMP kinase [bacterium]|nr:dTMP kinase [Candidatus Microgenomates bacterium CPR3]MCQ3944255.1 dTMP kinase [bacterium]RIK52082.1 MAG: dTMP kinase [Candidatus Microgenomates bacterium]